MKFAWQQIPSSSITELLCLSTCDGIVLDTEHSLWNEQTVSLCLSIIKWSGKSAYVRLGEVNKLVISKALDAGADGLIFSTIETPEQLRKIKSYANYPIYGGTRGLGLVRSNSWGDDNLMSKRKPVIIPQIETVTGVKNIEAIYSEGADFFLVGPYDLSSSLGIPGDFENEVFRHEIQKIYKAVPKENLAIHIPDNVQSHISKYSDWGLLALGMDTSSLIEKNKELFGG